MGFFDLFKKKTEAGDGDEAVNHKAVFSFESVPSTMEELLALPEIALDTPFKAAALTLLALCNYEKDENITIEMIEYLNGPDNVSTSQRQFLFDRLNGKFYKTFSFFEGASPDNGYTPALPLTITVSEKPNSYPQEDRAILYVKSAGADADRPIVLRKKPSTGQWFVADIQCLADIRVPRKDNPWA